MKKLFPLLLLLLLVFGNACQSIDDEQVIVKKLSWEVGEDNFAAKKTILITEETSLFLSMKRNSLCESTGVKVTITGEEDLYEETVFQFPFSKTISIPPNEKLTIHSSTLLNRNNEMDCKRLGLAEITVEF